ncbi:MAG: hypothetical protein JXN59_17660 [Anaerolineae bacterium]|nr:hypothetical protein [Anaerolineae bacterium]
MNGKRLLFLVGMCLLAAAGLVGNAAAQGGEGSLEVQLASPGQGEIFYSAPAGMITSVPVSGRVVSYDAPVDLETVELTLTFIDDSGAMIETHAPVGEDGHFHIWATINTQGTMPFIDDHLVDVCMTCHDSGQIDLPNNVAQLLVHARTPDGLTGSAVRDVRLDRGAFQTLEVEVEGLPEHSQGAQVVASTTVYEWRPRSFYAGVVDGQARVDVEQLTYADLDYEIAFPPVIIEAMRYEAEPQALTLPAGGGPLPAVTLHARPVPGAMTGRVVLAGSGAAADAASVLAVDLLTGAGHTTTTGEDGAFVLEELPVSEYAVLARSSAGVHVPGRYDLRQDIAPEIAIHLVRGGPDTLQGRVMLEGEPLPFAQVEVDGLLPAQADPLTGEFALAAVPAGEAVDMTITAPGCYSEQRRVEDRDLGAVALALHPDTTVLDQGGTRVYLPAETRATRDEDEVRLEQGVLWVNGEAAADQAGFTIAAGEYRLSGAGASYAVEAARGALPRLYVRQGAVTAARAEQEPLTVTAGQTLTLSGEAARPADLLPGAGSLLREVGGSTGRFVPRPTASEQLADGAWQATEGAARVLMLGAYAITFAGLPLFLIGGLVVWLRRRSGRA